MMDYHLFSWGANSHGQLGFGYESEQSTSPGAVDLSVINLGAEKIRKIVGGGGHTMILDNTGIVYSCGWNNKGQTGIPIENNIPQFRIIEALRNEKITNLACGWDSSIALTENGEIYVWGSNTFGQLGLEHGEIMGKENELHKINSFGSKVKSISMGLRHSAIVTENGEVFVTGSGNKCQLGIIDHEDVPIQSIHSFTRVPHLRNIIDVACGQHFTIALSKDGQLYSWGSNKHGQLGFDHEKTKNCGVPKKIAHVHGQIKELKIGWTHASILSVDGKISSWGRNTYGQLGCQQINKSWRLRSIENISSICQLELGSEHSIAIDDGGRVFSWGWNEHGNCGNGTTTNIFKPCRMEFPEGFTGVLIGSGAGHSFSVMRRNRVDL